MRCELPMARSISQTAANKKPPLLIVDDDPVIVDSLSAALESDFSPRGAGSRAEAKSAIRQANSAVEFALVDLGLPPRPHRPDEGFAVIRDLLAASPGCVIVVVSGQDSQVHAKRARALGAVEFVNKPCDPARLGELLLAARQAQKAAAKDTGLLGDSPPIRRLREQISTLADAAFPVLIEGESGSGKEVVARALHRLGRAGRPFLALNCAAISPQLVEPTLFGHARGSFTGASAASSGYFEDAADGALFLDEIGEMPTEVQPKLLRVLEEGEFHRVGETTPRRSAARIIAATNRRLLSEVRRGRFREDLYHRLSVFTLDAPPLCELGGDKMSLLNHFRDIAAAELNAAIFKLDESASQLWLDYHFPGNVRELKNIVTRLLVKYPGKTLGAEELTAELCPPLAAAAEELLELEGVLRAQMKRSGKVDLPMRITEIENAYAQAALSLCGGDSARARTMLGVDAARFGELINRGE